MIYLDNSATTYPKPKAVQAAAADAMRVGANPGRSGHALSMKAAEMLYRCRKEAADFFHCSSPECVVFTPSCTCAINFVLKGLLKRGDHVVCTNLEHNAVMRPLTALEKQGISYTAAEVEEGNNDRTINNFRKMLQKNTALVICTQASNVTGVRVPVERIAALCREYGIPVAVDAAQSAGLLPVDMEDTGIAYLCVPGHKGLYGPMGTGMLLTKKDAQLKTILEGGTGTASSELEMPDTMPEQLEPGTVNFSGIAGLRAGIRFVRQYGREKIFRQEIELMQLLYDRLSRIAGIRLYTQRPTLTHHVPVLSFNLKGIDSETAAHSLNRSGIAVRAGLHCAPAAHRSIGTLEMGTIRVSPSVFTTKEAIFYLVKQVENFVKKIQK